MLAVALGVAAVLAIELAGQAAAGSFQSSLQTLTGTSNLEVTASGGVPPEVFARLAALPYPLKLHARIEDYGVIDGAVRRAIPIIGIDLISEGAIEKSVRQGETRAFSDPRSEPIGLAELRAWDIRAAIAFDYSSTTRRRILPFAECWTIRAGDAVLMDLAPATRLLRRGGRLDRILIEAPPSRSIEDWETLLRQSLPLASPSRGRARRPKKTAACWSRSAGIFAS